jgi:hypothetical protein
MKTLSGGCLCGSIEYTISDALIYAGYCHCSECRRWTGAPFSATGGVKSSDFILTIGKPLLSSFKKGKNSTSYFCSHCSSIVYGVVPEHKMNYVMLGTLTESPSLKPQWHIYTGSKVDWYQICDDLPQYQGSPTPQ